MSTFKRLIVFVLMVSFVCACQPMAEQNPVQASATRGSALGRPLRAGDPAPDFRLVSATGAQVHLADELKAGGPVVLIFYTGGFCRLCLDALRALQAQLPQFQASGAQLFAIASQSPAEAAASARDAAVQYPVLADPQAQVARQYGVHPLLPGRTKGNQTPVSVFIVAASGTILWSGSALANGQPAVATILAQLRH